MAYKKQFVDPVTGRGVFYGHPEATEENPNILFISLDMVPRDFYLDFEKTVPVKAPAIHGLRDNHIFFDHAYCVSPLCTPSRAGYLTGRFPYITGNSERAHDGHLMHMRDEDTLFPEYLKSIGYHLRHVGKSHVGTHKFMDIFGENDTPWDRWSPPWYDDDEYIRFLHNKGLERISFERMIYGESASGRGKGNFYGGWISEQNGSPFPKEATYPAFLVEKAITALETRRYPSSPFYLQLDFFGPHQPFAIPGGMEEREEEIRRELELPYSYQQLIENGFNAPWEEPRVYRLYRKNWGLQDPETMREYITANILQFECIDEQIGRLFDYLKAHGLYDNTWIFFIADHGEMNGEMGLADKGSYLNPGVIQVPIILKPAADHPAAELQSRIQTPVSLLDIPPTIFDICDITPDALLDGFSLLKTIQEEQRPGEKPILFDIWAHVIPNPCIGMLFRAGDENEYMYVFNASDDVDELYLIEEKKTLVNRVSDPAFSHILQEALETMHQILQHDRRWKGYADYFGLTYAEKLSQATGDRQHFK